MSSFNTNVLSYNDHFFLKSDFLYNYTRLYFQIISLSGCLKDNWQYKQTICPDGWLDHNGFCYRYLEEKSSWDSSSSACKALEAELVSVHSLSQQELLLKLLLNGWLDIILK